MPVKHRCGILFQRGDWIWLSSQKKAALYTKKTGPCWLKFGFPEGEDGTVAITRTFVDEALRGQGMAGQLMQRAAEHLRAGGKKAVPVCSYAVAWFEKHPEYADVLAGK